MTSHRPTPEWFDAGDLDWPMADGTIPEPQVQRLRAIGAHLA